MYKGEDISMNDGKTFSGRGTITDYWGFFGDGTNFGG
jgi:hypothetical protein